MSIQPERRGVLALMGSPRTGGNTDILTDVVLEAIRTEGVLVEKLIVRRMKISPCLEINECYRSGRCAMKDDMAELYDKLLTAQAVIIASPIFFYGPSAQLKMLIDRCQALWADKYILHRRPVEPPGRGYLISVGATKGKKLFDGFELTARYFFDALDMKIEDRLLVRSVDHKGEVKNRLEVMEEAAAMGRKIALNFRSK